MQTVAPLAAERRTEPTYRPHLDGLRAVAVYLVVLFHAGSDRFPGGYIGVDVFFVLSGFLVTQLLLRDVERSGTIGLRRFYARRFRRLLPAASVMLLVSALMYSALATPVEVAAAKRALQAAFLYVVNLYFIDQSTDYFAADVTTNPVLHYWSLAVEEQFYLLWPLALGGLLALSARFGSRQRRVLQGAVATIALASLLWALSLRSANPTRAYFGTDARAHQLMAGAVVALTPGLIARFRERARVARAMAAAGLVGLVAVASSWVDLEPITRGVAAMVVSVAVIVALETTGGSGVTAGVLSAQPMVYLGKISYGTYLWHWPVVWVLAQSFDLSVPTTVVLTAGVASALASLSYQLLEQPIRASALLDRRPSTVITAGLAVSAVCALVIIPRIAETSTTSAAPATTDVEVSDSDAVPPGLDFAAIQADFPDRSSCYDAPPAACTLVEGNGDHVLLIGDSHAQMMIPAFESIAEREDLTFSASVHFVCPWQRDLFAVTRRNPDQQMDTCERERGDLYERVIPALDPDVIVVMNRGYEVPDQRIQYRGPDRAALPASSPSFADWLDEVTNESLASLKADRRNVVVLEPIPYDREVDQLACLSDAEVVAECRFAVDTAPSKVEQLYRRLDEQDDQVWSADLDRLVCPYLPICDPIVDGQVVRTDGTHLTRGYARTLDQQLEDFLTDNAILAP